jgi:hypothetical protein
MAEYELSIFWIVVGVIIFLMGAFMVGFYKPIADNMGIGSYNRLRMWGLIFCVVGLLIIPNLLSWLLNSLLAWFFGRLGVSVQ